MSNYKSSLNQTAAIGRKKVEHLGKNYASIDFEINERVDSTECKYSKMKPIVGTFVIGNKKVEVTLSELNHIASTAIAATQACDLAYRMGKWGQPRTR